MAEAAVPAGCRHVMKVVYEAFAPNGWAFVNTRCQKCGLMRARCVGGPSTRAFIAGRRRG